MKYRVLIFFLILIIPFLTGMKCVPASHKDDVVDPDSICGIWELRKEGPRFIQKGTFSWGENVFSTTSL